MAYQFGSSSQCERSKYFLHGACDSVNDLACVSNKPNFEPYCLVYLCRVKVYVDYFASGSKARSLSVVLSLKREPIARITSAVISALFCHGMTVHSSHSKQEILVDVTPEKHPFKK